MALISIEQFSAVKAPLQARDIGRLVSRNADWLQESPYDEEVYRYGAGWPTAVKNVASVSQSPVEDAGIVRMAGDGRGKAIGLATLLHDRTLLHTGEGHT